jgi:hypothetical protein
MPVMITPLARASMRPASSSIANTTPASGALKAAAMPAAPPAISSARVSIVLPADNHRRACCITPAATCTEGPSRPMDSPAANPAVPRRILPADNLRDANQPQWSAGSSGSIAALI